MSLAVYDSDIELIKQEIERSKSEQWSSSDLLRWVSFYRLAGLSLDELRPLRESAEVFFDRPRVWLSHWVALACVQALFDEPMTEQLENAKRILASYGEVTDMTSIQFTPQAQDYAVVVAILGGDRSEIRQARAERLLQGKLPDHWQGYIHSTDATTMALHAAREDLDAPLDVAQREAADLMVNSLYGSRPCALAFALQCARRHGLSLREFVEGSLLPLVADIWPGWPEDRGSRVGWQKASWRMDPDNRNVLEKRIPIVGKGPPTKAVIYPLQFYVLGVIPDELEAWLQGKGTVDNIPGVYSRADVTKVLKSAKGEVHLIAEEHGDLLDPEGVRSIVKRVETLEEWLRVRYPKFQCKLSLKIERV